MQRSRTGTLRTPAIAAYISPHSLRASPSWTDSTQISRVTVRSWSCTNRFDPSIWVRIKLAAPRGRCRSASSSLSLRSSTSIDSREVISDCAIDRASSARALASAIWASKPLAVALAVPATFASSAISRRESSSLRSPYGYAQISARIASPRDHSASVAYRCLGSFSLCTSRSKSTIAAKSPNDAPEKNEWTDCAASNESQPGRTNCTTSRPRAAFYLIRSAIGSQYSATEKEELPIIFTFLRVERPDMSTILSPMNTGGSTPRPKST